MTSPLLVAVGCLNIDITARIPKLPAKDDRLMAEPFSTSLGGMATNVGCAAAGLGEPWPIQAELIAPLGNDADGILIETELTSKGVSTNWLDRESRTHRCLILVEADGARSIISEPAQLNYALVAARLRAGIEGDISKLLYVDGFHALALLDYVNEASSRGWHTAVDLDELPADSMADIEDFAAQFDVVFVNRHWARQLFPDSPEPTRPELLAELATATGSLILLTLGADGAIVCAPSASPVAVPALQVEVKDTTGAGDVFAGVFLSGWLHGLSTVEAARHATVAASLSTTAVGAQGCLPTHSRIARRL